MFQKELYFLKEKSPKKGMIRSYTEKDFTQLMEVQKESFPPPFPSELWWNEEQLHNHITIFPEGALCAEMDGEIVGSITGLRVTLDQNSLHTWEEITDNGYIRNHEPTGNTLYIVDICIKPSYRSFGIGKWLMQSMYEVVVHHRIDRLAGGGRMPRYHLYRKTHSPEEYLQSVLSGEIVDPVITFLLRCGRIPVTILPHYLEDEESLHNAVLMEWKNPFIKK